MRLGVGVGVTVAVVLVIVTVDVLVGLPVAKDVNSTVASFTDIVRLNELQTIAQKDKS